MKRKRNSQLTWFAKGQRSQLHNVSHSNNRQKQQRKEAWTQRQSERQKGGFEYGTCIFFRVKWMIFYIWNGTWWGTEIRFLRARSWRVCVVCACMHETVLCTESKTIIEMVILQMPPVMIKEITFIRSKSHFKQRSHLSAYLILHVNAQTAGPFSDPAEIHNPDFRHTDVHSLLSFYILTLASRSIKAELFQSQSFL